MPEERRAVCAFQADESRRIPIPSDGTYQHRIAVNDNTEVFVGAIIPTVLRSMRCLVKMPSNEGEDKESQDTNHTPNANRSEVGTTCRFRF